MRQPYSLGLDGSEVMIERKTALRAGDAWCFSEGQLGPAAGIHIINVGQTSLMAYQPKGCLNQVH